MKITDVKLSDPWYSSVRAMADATVKVPGVRASMILEVSTDEGITGVVPMNDPIVQIGHEGVSLNKVLVEQALKPLVVGEDPLDTERIWDKMYWGSVRRRLLPPRVVPRERPMLHLQRILSPSQVRYPRLLP